MVRVEVSEVIVGESLEGGVGEGGVEVECAEDTWAESEIEVEDDVVEISQETRER